MPTTLIREHISGDAPGESIELNYYRLGDSSVQPKIYLQAALHADEQPGIMILHHLLKLLSAADDANQLNAQFVIFPMVNPLGMRDIRFGRHQGRYDPAIGLNHNRRWPDLFAAVKDHVADQLTADPASNLGLVRSLVAQWLAVQPKITALDCLRHLIISEAYDADVILDLHCDEDALNHIFISPALMPEYQDLADWMGSSATLTAVDSGGSSFDEVWSLLWSRLRDAFPAVPMPPAPLSATLEYRGNFHTFDALNQKDAANLFGFFQQRGWISGQSTQPPPAAPSAQNFAATEYLRVHTTGLLAYQVNNGDRVKTGDVIAELIVLDGDNPFRQRTPVLAGTDGLVFSRRIDKYVWPGCVIAKIAGDRKLDSRGAYLLSD